MHNEVNASRPKDGETADPLDHLGDFDSVPVIDFGGHVKGRRPNTGADRRRAPRCLHERRIFLSCQSWHSQELVDDAFALGPALLRLAARRQNGYSRQEITASVRYIGMRDESLDPNAEGKGDLHEAFDFEPPDLQIDGTLAPGDFRHVGNLWPENLPGFQENLIRYSVAMKRLSRQLFRPSPWPWNWRRITSTA